ncbi:hypothetical protein ACFB49_43410 [Sphingomonas sp. DBB INV C78]|uniref:DUF1345 domain-containing protein n=1 Tax=Sphingomonas sp. DBB INV C78 TaxID=3349434 RepID=UPI0036D403C7
MAGGGAKGKSGIGNRVAPPRFLAFILFALGGGYFAASLGDDWRMAVMLGFDGAAIVFLLSCLPLFYREADDMRRAAKENDANRVGLLVITGLVMAVILVAVGAELRLGDESGAMIVLIVATLVIAWLFSNFVYAMHYAHMFYTEAPGGGDMGGLGFPRMEEPDYWDFAYFAFTLGMTFQTSDVEISDRSMRRTVLVHGIAAFFFNIGVLAFSINVLGG